MEATNNLTFQPWRSAVDVSFWFDFSRKKLDVLRLSEEPVNISGYYTTGSPMTEPHFILSGDSFSPEFVTPRAHFSCPGTLFNMNTLDSFKSLDKKSRLEQWGRMIWDDMVSGAALKDLSLLSRFFVIAFADLKKYHYYYWFAFPSFATDLTTITRNESIREAWSEKQVTQFNEFCLSTHEKGWANTPFFLVKFDQDGQLLTERVANYASFFGANDEVTIGSFDAGQGQGTPAWTLRNFLICLNVQFRVLNVKVVLFKYPRGDDLSNNPSRILSLKLVDLSNFVSTNSAPPVVGFEKDLQGANKPKFMNMSSNMDSKQLAENASDLNLKLMRWRTLPSLSLEKVSSTRCLIVGAGTLGCNIARALLSWGVRTMTFVDNGKVSYSNPVRQTLFTFEDSRQGVEKAVAAAAAVKLIFPSVNSKGVVMTIPMPGHLMSNAKEEEETKNKIIELTGLIEEHDVIFLGLDSREARWLPTVIATIKNKTIINAALGFDSFLVVRHGMHPHDGKEQSPQLGCYFCNDVIAPGDTMKGRTLDQQCTVTRPGLSFLASSIAVELMVSLLHHPLGPYAPSENRPKNGEQASTELGIVPHQIRGFIASFDNLLLTGTHYNCCVACSVPILTAYQENPWEFCKKVFKNPLVLEEISGIAKMKEQTFESIGGEGEDDF